MNKTQIKELQGAITQMNTNDRAKSTFTIEDNFAYFTPEGHRAYKISVNGRKNLLCDTTLQIKT